MDRHRPPGPRRRHPVQKQENLGEPPPVKRLLRLHLDLDEHHRSLGVRLGRLQHAICPPCNQFIMTKLRAFAIHLTASVTIFLIFLGLLSFVWYPAPYFAIDGGWTVLRILAGAYLALGPLLP